MASVFCDPLCDPTCFSLCPDAGKIRAYHRKEFATAKGGGGSIFSRAPRGGVFVHGNFMSNPEIPPDPKDESRSPKALGSSSKAEPAIVEAKDEGSNPSSPIPLLRIRRPKGSAWSKNFSAKLARMRAQDQARADRKAEKERLKDAMHPWSATRRLNHRRAMRRVLVKRNRRDENPEAPQSPESPDLSRPKAGQSLVATRPQLLPEMVREQLEDFKTRLTTDLGGEGDLTTLKTQYVLRLAQLDAGVTL